MFSLGNVGNIGGLVAAVIGVSISAIILLTFAPTIAESLNQVYLLSVPACVIDGERIDRVVMADGYENEELGYRLAWYDAMDNKTLWTAIEEKKDNAFTANDRRSYKPLDCDFKDSGFAGRLPSGTPIVFTSSGTEIEVATDLRRDNKLWDVPESGQDYEDLTRDSDGYRRASPSLIALGSGSLVQILFGAMGILLPAGALGFLGYYGAMVVKEHMGGNTLSVAIGATITVVIVAAILPEVFDPLDDFYQVLANPQFAMFQSGIGTIARVLGNFFGVALVGGLISLGMILWSASTKDSTPTR